MEIGTFLPLPPLRGKVGMGVGRSKTPQEPVVTLTVGCEFQPRPAQVPADSPNPHPHPFDIAQDRLTPYQGEGTKGGIAEVMISSSASLAQTPAN
jgi:hypothetical protein